MRTLLLISFCIIFLSSCKEEKDSQYPTVSITSPSELSNYRVLDLLPIKASIQDNEIIKSVTITLFNSGTRIQAETPVIFYPNAPTFDLDFQYQISDSLLNSGEYYLKITADDGENQLSGFKTINVIGIPKRRLGFVAEIELNGSSSLYYINENGGSSSIQLLGSELKSIDIDNYHQNLWMIPKIGSTIFKYDLKEDRLESILVPNPNQFNEFFTDLNMEDKLAFVSNRNGQLDAYTQVGTDVFSYFSVQGEYVLNFETFSDLTLLSESSIGNLGYRVKSVNSNTGGEFFSFETDRKPIGFGFKNENEAFYFAQINTTFSIYDLDPKSGFHSRVYQRENIIVNSVKPIDFENYLVFTDSVIYQFNYRTNFFDPIASGSIIGGAVHDVLNNQIILGVGNQFRVFDLGTRSFVRTETLPGNIRNVAVRFNK